MSEEKLMKTIPGHPPMNLFSVEKVAELMDVHEVSVRTMIKEGKLGGRKFGKRIWVSENELKDYFGKTQIEKASS